MRTFLLTGAASGIGRATARALAHPTRTLLLVDRNTRGLHETASTLSGPCRLATVDLSSQAEIRDFTASIAAHPVDVLINNAGLLCEEPLTSTDGFELTFAVNAVAPFLLTRLLWAVLSRASDGRVVNVSSLAHAHGRIDLDELRGTRQFTRYGAYARSKLAVLLLTRACARRAGPELTINAIHPGVVGTGLGEGGLISRMLRFARPLLKSPEDGAKGLVHLATEPSIQGIRGRYFVGTSDTEPSPRGRDDQIGEQLYTWLDTQLGPLPPLTVTPEGSH